MDCTPASPCGPCPGALTPRTRPCSLPCAQFVRGLQCLHARCLLHGDVKLLNVLVCLKDGTWYVSDLGAITPEGKDGQPALCK